MPRRRPQNPFVDLEAEVDCNDSDEDASNEDEDNSTAGNFIHDEIGDENGDENVDSDDVSYKTWIDFQREDDADEAEETRSFLQHLQDRLQKECAERRTSESLAEDPGLEGFKPIYPIYRVACVAGNEENAMFYIYQKVKNEKIASVVVRPSIVGYIYIEGKFDDDVKKLLLRTPGIRKTHQGPIREMVDQGDWSQVLTMKGKLETACEGQWVLVRDGSVYDGDVALVSEVHSWGVHLWVVPRIVCIVQHLQGLWASEAKGTEAREQRVEIRKRKRPGPRRIPDPQLWHDWKAHLDLGRDVEVLSPHCVRLGKSHFEHGLLKHPASFYGIQASPATIPSSSFSSFIKSGHPSVLNSQYRLIRPQEWCVDHHDYVEDTQTEWRGYIKEIDVAFVQVALEEGGLLHKIPWVLLRKVIRVGDYVTVMSGTHAGIVGWVVAADGDEVHIVEKDTKQNDTTEVKHVIAHVNWVKIATMPFSGTAQAVQERASVPRDYQPWLNLRVLITKGVWKGRHGIVYGVIKREKTQDLDVRLENYDPTRGFPNVIVNIDSVVEAISQLDLLLYSRMRHLYLPPTSTYPNTSNTSNPFLQPCPEIGATPLSCDLQSRVSPAWDPNSLTPRSLGSDAESPMPPSSPTHPPHELLHSRLLTLTFKVNVHGGDIPGSALTATVEEKDDGSLGFRGIRRGRKCWFEPSWVSSRRPVPNRGDNGAIVITRGTHPHHGSHVRRLTHIYEGERCVMRCLIVQYMKGGGDVGTDEEILLEDWECTLRMETAEEKRLNKTLVNSLRLRMHNEPS